MKNCEEVTLDIERSRFERLSLKNRMNIWVHISICKMCRKYAKDSKVLDELIRRRFRQMGKEDCFRFSEKEKTALKELLKRN